MNKTAIITGAYGAIGKAIALGIAQSGEYRIVLVGRDESSLKNTVEDISKGRGTDEVSYEVADLSLKSSIKSLARRIDYPVNILVNNAATCPRERKETDEGVELQFATNVLGYYWLAQELNEQLGNAAPSRIVNVASYWAGGLDLNDPEFKTRSYDNHSAYRQSKQANRMLTVASANRLDPNITTINSCHPGEVNSKLSNDLGFGGSESPEKGADTPVWLAISEEVEGVSGKYFADSSEVACKFSTDKIEIEKLYELCSKY
ncbi:MAG: SDR family NAD(P)-dependent oxidoreductase [Bacteroidetes bacterium]|nr:SDR family NAD(P)-dependent oxidoreductase [Bacteroidota bacterium]